MAKKFKNTKKDLSFQKMSVVDGSKAYAELRQRIVKHGILDRAYGYYAVLITCIIGGFLISAYNLYIQTAPLLLIVWGLAFAFFAVQIGGLLHDAGHRTIFKSTLMNDIFGYFFASLVTMGYTNWKLKHNMHHAHPNQEDEDPDIEIPLSFTEDRYKGRKGVIGFIRKYQAYLYFPLGSLVWVSMRLKGLKYFKEEFGPKIIWEVVMFACGFFLWFILPFLIFDLSKALLLFFVINPATGLYLFNVFAPNHKGMPQLAKGVKLSFMEHQILTSRNIHGHWFTDFIYMGLNYQIEHHLFPNTPRNKLPLITPYLLAFCKKRKLEYTSVNILESNKIILRELHQISST